VAMKCLGGLLREEAIAIPERHLGLVTDDEHGLAPAAVDRLADLIETRLDLDDLLNRLPEIDLDRFSNSHAGPKRTAPAPEVRIGVARDKAFCFYYPDNFDILRSAGAELVFFSPMEIPTLPQNLDGLYFGGGYPELFVRPLSQNEPLRREIQKNSRNGMPIYAECGGFMYLGSRIQDTDNRTYPMCGCFPFTTTMFTRLKSLGYREVSLTAETLLGPAGTRIRGHEFHYSGIREAPENEHVETVYAVSDRLGAGTLATGYRVRRTLGSYIHLHFGSRPEAAEHFVAVCRRFRRERKTAS
jgi:cobyrinic acid a,c-diamide synthase